MKAYDGRMLSATPLQSCILVAALCASITVVGVAAEEKLVQAPNTWVKRTPLHSTPPSPRLGYEGACVWDSKNKLLIRYGGHNQGGGGEQHSELWTFDLHTAQWTLKEPNTSPVGICCGQQNVFDPVQGRYIRFPAFSGSHGWQWAREIYLNDSSVWTYDLGANRWRNMRPLPTPSPRPLRCASWDSEYQVIVLFGGEGSTEGTLVYDPHANTWTRMNPASQPEFRSGGNMAYDAAQRLHILFGSQFSNDPHTWTYDLRTNRWRDMTPASMPPTDRNDAVLAYHPQSRLVIAVVKITEGEEESARHRLETWSYDTGKNQWTKTDPPQEPDPSGNRARVLASAPELGLLVLENRTHPPHGPPEQQIWTYRPPSLLTDRQLPAMPPLDLKLTTRADSITLQWEAIAGDGAERYEVFRGLGDTPWQAVFDRIASVAADRHTYVDTALEAEKVYYYKVAAVAGPERTIAESSVRCTQPPVVEDIVVSVLAPDHVELNWMPRGTEMTGYHLERAPVEVLSEDQLKRLKTRTPPLSEPSVGVIRRIGRFVRLTARPVAQPHFADRTVELNRPVPIQENATFDRSFPSEQLDESGTSYRYAVYAYRIRAVSPLGTESGPSPATFTIPSAPQFVFAREGEDNDCHIKWESNREVNIRGYRVYRMDGRFDNEPIQRLTSEPVAATNFTDAAAGGRSRRYYVVAVDALGQEGFPSSPVWHNREWRKFYVPFIGEWHQ